MKERGILFSKPMVRAQLDGSKTQTRRAVKHQLRQLGDGYWYEFDHKGLNYRVNSRVTTTGAWQSLLQFCPYGQPGDRLWVRETFYAFGAWMKRFSEKKQRDEWHFVDMTQAACVRHEYVRPVGYRALPRTHPDPAWWRRPAIFMPRVASRILLEIVSVRVERLQDISGKDAEAEGAPFLACYGPDCPDGPDGCNARGCYGAREWYQQLWNQINGAGSFDANPWVWVVEFKRIEQ